ncbi:MAG: ABC transporter permease, partial [Puniceicoccales bacterium]
YFYWLGNIAQGNLGYSWSYKLPVSELIGQRLFATFLLSLTSILFAWIIAIPLGVLAAIYKDSIWDRISSILAYAALSIPEFFLALLAVYFAARTGWFPLGGATSIEYDYLSFLGKINDRLYHLFLPTIVLGIGSIASIMRIMRANFLDQIRADYVNTARAKGLPEGWIMFKHVLRNAINPLISAFGFAFSSLLSGALLVENVMNYPGLGRLIFQSILKEDQFVVLASVMLSCTMLVIGNLVADILLAWSDPRIRLEAKES